MTDIPAHIDEPARAIAQICLCGNIAQAQIHDKVVDALEAAYASCAPKKRVIIHRNAGDDFDAWRQADVAAKEGLRVVSIVVDPNQTPILQWHIFVEAPEGYDTSVLDKKIEESRSKVR